MKFYAADPCKLLEEITRYQLFLQVKQDVLQGRLPVSFELAAELGAYVVQCEGYLMLLYFLHTLSVTKPHKA